MIEPIFRSSEYDDDATRKNVLHALRGYKGLIIKRQQLEAYHLSGQAYDGMPHSTTNINHEEEKEMKRLEKQEANEWEITLLNNALKLMGQVDDHSEQLADVLRLQFFEFNKVEVCCYKFSQKYKLPDFPRQTFYDYRKEALLKFPLFYPRELRVKKDGK
ncbi:hypothetical protein [Lactiplantibacillus daowaiensis]|uniref:Transcriptional regulator n=1 Tax=Lactiplantibacillus daowaiensis TaxID=2559918 RepID=A0ABW1RXZ2_9LACO|nr:hypothetical protein [Lactiplantibacillus daowaiensis]